MPINYFRAWDVVLAVTDVTFGCGKLVEKPVLVLNSPFTFQRFSAASEVMPFPRV